ncbi:MAG: hypothetical protein JSV49_01005 [Thermoplasmata archaeon]|nr:MAG: hypothetical protein JSV49_01005 [Thermoplasmata archaeon]
MDFEIVIDEIFNKVEYIEITGYLEKEDGKVITGSIKPEGGRLVATLDEQIVFDESIEQLRAIFLDNLNKLLQDNSSTGMKKLEQLFIELLSVQGVRDYAGMFVYIFILLFNFDRLNAFLYNLKKNIMAKSTRVEINGTGEIKIKYRNDVYVIKAILEREKDTISVDFEGESYEISVRNRYGLIMTALPLFAHVTAVLGEEQK